MTETSAQPGPSDAARATRDSLLELAAHRFVEHGYARTSVRDLARESERTTGALYGHFRNKADLLVEVIAARMASDLEDMPAGREWTVPESLARLRREYRRRAGLRALLLEGAAAARQDDDVRDRLGRQQADKLEEWAELLREWQVEGGLASDVDVDVLVVLLYAVELGLGVLEAYGIDLPEPEQWVEARQRLVGSFGT